MNLFPKYCITTASIGAILGAVHLLGICYQWEQSTVDLRLLHRPKTTAPAAIALVAVGDDDVADPRFGSWPFPRSIHADVIRILRSAGASHITFDFLFNDPTEAASDNALAGAIAEADDVTLAYHFVDLKFPENSSESEFQSDSPFDAHFATGHRYGVDVRGTSTLLGIEPVPLFGNLSPSLGTVNVKADANNSVIRHVPMFIQYRGKLYPGLALQTLIATLHLEPDQIRIEAGKQIQLVDTSLGTLRIPVDKRLQYRINFTSGVEEFVPAFQYNDLYQAVNDPEYEEILTKAVSGRPVLVGLVSTGTSDVVTTPIGRLPGVLAQATAIANILTQNHLRFFPGWLQILWCGAIGLILGFILRSGSAWVTVTIVSGFALAYFIAALFAARSNWMIPLLPVLELCLISMIGMLWLQVSRSRNAHDRTLRALSKYVSPAVAHRALREESFATEPTERREITIFFSDIRGFTVWSDRKEPEEITSVLNDYLKAMTEIVAKHGGTLDKFVGDCVMVLFNAPENMEDHSERALKMAWDMQKKIAALSESWKAKGSDPIGVGMGIHTGFATVGNFGSDLYSDYTAIGNSVNIASRLESVSKSGQILISNTAKKRTEGIAETVFVEKKALKGIKEPVDVYEVINVSTKENSGQ